MYQSNSKNNFIQIYRSDNGKADYEEDIFCSDDRIEDNGSKVIPYKLPPGYERSHFDHSIDERGAQGQVYWADLNDVLNANIRVQWRGLPGNYVRVKILAVYAKPL